MLRLPRCLVLNHGFEGAAVEIHEVQGLWTDPLLGVCLLQQEDFQHIEHLTDNRTQFYWVLDAYIRLLIHHEPPRPYLLAQPL